MEPDVQTPQSTPSSGRSNVLFVPMAIVIGLGLIAAAIYFTGGRALSTSNPVLTTSGNTASTTSGSIIPPVTAQDHILGNPNAPIMIVEYSDFDCPYCQEFQATLHQIMNEYGATGKVAWVFRDFPIQQLHPNAPALALDAECVSSLGGNKAFWKFADLVFNGRDPGQETDMSKVPDFVKQTGVDMTAYNQCVQSGKYNNLIQKTYNEAIKAGAKGTPFTVIEVGGQHGVINGARPYAQVKNMVETLISQIDNTQPNITPVGTSTAPISTTTTQ